LGNGWTVVKARWLKRKPGKFGHNRKAKGEKERKGKAREREEEKCVTGEEKEPLGSLSEEEKCQKGGPLVKSYIGKRG